MTYLILGCGWVGEAFAMMLKAEGHTVYASTTNIAKQHRLQADAVSVFLTDFDKPLDYALFPDSVDYILNSIPASKDLAAEDLDARFQRIHTLLSKVSYKKHIFLSSVGIYPDESDSFTEGSPCLEGSHLRRAELWMEACADTVVYRLGGLFGRDRVFAKYFQGRVCKTGEQPANFIHSDDVLNLILLGFQQELKANCYNLVAPAHPLKRAVILTSAKKYGFALPKDFETELVFQKIVCGQKLTTELEYTFQQPSPLEF